MSLQSVSSAIDSRQQQLEQWLRPYIGDNAHGVAAGSDAGFRRYFRYQYQGRSVIAMDAPPVTEDCRPFVKVAGLLAKAGVLVPDIIAADVEQGFLLLSDLGASTYLQRMQQADFTLELADPLFAEAIEALIKFQQVSEPGCLPDYDEPLLRRELALFPEWYLQRHLGLAIEPPLRDILDRLFTQLTEQVLSQAKVFVHRDYMPRNLMINDRDDKGVGVLDFQDAVYGPISYDITCLFKDAFISWPEHKVEQWLQQYWQQAAAAGLPVPCSWSDFQRDCDYMGAQRHLKVLGIFARICHRDGKSHYLADAPRFFNYLQAVALRRTELTALTELLRYLDQRLC